MAQQINIEQRKYNIIAVVGTMLVHSLLFLLCYFIFFYTPIPPWPEGGGGGGLGIEVNLGTSETGFGDIQTDNISMPDFTPSSSNNNVLTQDNDATSAINESKDNNNKDINQAAIYKGKKDGGSQGEKGGTGDQGKKDGNKNSSNYNGKGTGGTGGGTGGGNGTGNGPGDGPGDGPGKGKGVSFSLNGRSVKSLPKPVYNSKEEGTVVVSIWVDKKGKVTKAVAGGRGTTTTNTSLWKLATDAALKATFDVKADAPEEQKGTITYNFINLN
ncbi:MAG: hypothetical protein WCM76_03990 [Bacteroidota bacterium]